MRTTLAGVLVLWLVGSAVATGFPFVHAQTSLQFEVVSIKPRKGVQPGGRDERLPSGRRILENVSTRGLITQGYPTKVDLVGAPDWVLSDRFDVEALPSFVPTLEQERAMFRDMLTDRFKLRAHYETQERPVYFVTFARADHKLGPQIHPVDIDCATYKRDPNRALPPITDAPAPCSFRMFAKDAITIVSGGRSIQFLADSLSPMMGRAILDRTGLQGDYAFSLSSFEVAGGTDTVSVFAAFEEQLGLKLEAGRAPVDVVVIDHIERPTPD